MNSTITGLNTSKIQLDNYFKSIAPKEPEAQGIQARVFSKRLGVDYSFSNDSLGQPFYVGDVGKLFISTVILQLVEEEKIELDDPIDKFFFHFMYDKLFVYDGLAYYGSATVQDLLAHTSGLADYFAGPTDDGQTILEEAQHQIDTCWSPRMLLDFSRNHQRAVGIPGDGASYSNTGYVLLGMIIEKVTGKSLAQNMRERFFFPLGMSDSYLFCQSKPINKKNYQPLQRIWLQGFELSQSKSLSVGLSNANLVSTPEDLLKFNQALWNRNLLRKSSIDLMKHAVNNHRQGVYLGTGMMEVRLSEVFSIHETMPSLWGHYGIAASHLYYVTDHDAHIILNFGADYLLETSFKALLYITRWLKQVSH